MKNLWTWKNVLNSETTETARWSVLFVTLQSVNDIIMIVNTVDKHALVSI